MDPQEKIRQQVSENRVVLYMKGTPDAPQCGFSAAAVQILEACGADEVATVNVLADADKAFRVWHGMASGMNLLVLGGLGFYLWGMANPGNGTRFVPSGKFRS